MKPRILHPFLLAVFPVLFLFAHNIDEVPARAVVLPLLLITSASGVSWGLLSFIVKDRQEAGLLVSLCLVLFFSYGHFANLLESLDVRIVLGEVVIGPHKILYPIWGIVFILGVIFIHRTRRLGPQLTAAVNLAAAFLVGISLLQVAVYELRSWDLSEGRGGDTQESEVLQRPDNAHSYPDIYYVVLDGYARADVLTEIYDYDNSDFIQYLRTTGFILPPRSTANYCQTALSLASSLNLQYVDALLGNVEADSDYRKPLGELIRNNRVVEFLRKRGYAFVAFSSAYYLTDFRRADTYVSNRGLMDEFEITLVNSTPLPPLLEKIRGLGWVRRLVSLDAYDSHRERIVYTFDHLADRTDLPGPKFVFAHIMAPHPPFVFGPHGERINPDRVFSTGDGNHFLEQRGATRKEYLTGYRNQLVYVNGKLKEALEGILSRSPRPPIIILQSDHGPGSLLDWENPERTNVKERLAILSAYHLPGYEAKDMPDTISPVNTFRIISNHYFGTQYELLPDKSYFSTWSRPYRFLDVTEEMKASLQKAPAPTRPGGDLRSAHPPYRNRATEKR